jgi:hypothetical protein
MDQEKIIPSPVEHVTMGHLATIAGTIVLLLVFTFVKNPQIFSLHKTEATVSVDDPSVPRYYAYVPPAELQQPMVAGANTEPEGPSLINEDGSITSAAGSGEVLGISTDQMNLNLDSVIVASEVSNSPEAVKKYLAATELVEENYINNSDFEIALSSQDQVKIDVQVKKIQGIILDLQKISVPHAAVALHKNKIVQYNAAITVLQNFINADDNPELVSQALGVFLQAEDTIGNETSKLYSTYSLANETNN